jgi:hypothetical protein
MRRSQPGSARRRWARGVTAVVATSRSSSSIAAFTDRHPCCRIAISISRHWWTFHPLSRRRRASGGSQAATRIIVSNYSNILMTHRQRRAIAPFIWPPGGA